MVFPGKALAGVHHPFGLLAAKRTATCRFSKLIASWETLQDHFPLFAPPPQFPGDDYLGDLQKNQIPILHALLVVFKDVEILGRVSICFQKEAVKGVIYFLDSVFRPVNNL